MKHLPNIVVGWAPWHSARPRIDLRLTLAALIVAVMAGGCGRAQPEVPAFATSPTPGPNLEATVVAEVQARIGPGAAMAPSPTPLPVTATKDLVSFARSYAEMTADMEQLHTAIDEWRGGLISCEASSMLVSLRGFASGIGSVASKARALPRTRNVRELSDRLVSAVEQEEETVRMLRDGWRPDDQTALENVAVQRASALGVLREVQDEVLDFQESTTPPERARIEEFALALESLNSGWDEFRAKYDSFRSREPHLTSTAVVVQLSDLVEQFRGLVEAARGLPDYRAPAGVARLVAEAVEAEDLALRRLRGTFEKSANASDLQVQHPVKQPPPASEGETNPAPAKEGSATQGGDAFVAKDPRLFDEFDAQLARSNALRRQARSELFMLLEGSSDEARSEAAKFSQQLQLLQREWKAFHEGYDEWRRTEGGCDRTKAAETLAQLTSRFAALTATARQLPGGSLLGTFRELMVEASETEEFSFRELRDSWRPFDVEVYKRFEGRRSAAAKLRRQVVTGLKQLLDQHEVTVPSS